MVAKSSARRELSVELDAVMEAIGAEKKKKNGLDGLDVAKKTPILSKRGHRVMWLCEVDGELMVLQKLRDFREAEKKEVKENIIANEAEEEEEEEEERVSKASNTRIIPTSNRVLRAAAMGTFKRDAQQGVQNH